MHMSRDPLRFCTPGIPPERKALAIAGAAYGRQTATPTVPSVTVNTTTGTLLTLKTFGALGNRPAILSISENGQFLTSKGPTLIVPNDSGKRNLKQVSAEVPGQAK